MSTTNPDPTIRRVVSPESTFTEMNPSVTTNTKEVLLEFSQATPPEDTIIMFGMYNIIAEHRHEAWDECLLEDFYDSDTERVRTDGQASEWTYLRHKIIKHVCQTMQSTLTREQLELYEPENQLQIYLISSDNRFRVVLH
jgi:hypothetical protein